jgi:hypothetical protein
MSEHIEAPEGDRPEPTPSEVSFTHWTSTRATDRPDDGDYRVIARRRTYILAVITLDDEGAARAVVRYLLSQKVGQVASPE